MRSEKDYLPSFFQKRYVMKGDERDRLMIVDRISVLAIQTINNAKKKRNLHQKRLLFKVNDYLYKQNNKRSLLMQKLAIESTSLVSKSLPI